MFDDPELELGVVDEGDGRFGGACDLVVAALEIDGVVVVDAALLAQGKVQVEQSGSGSGAEALRAGEQGVVPDGGWDEAGAALAGAVLALEFHLEDVVGELWSGDFRVGEEGDDAALEGAEAAFDFAFCLRGGCDEVGDAEGAEGALEFALWIAAIGAGAWAEKTECVGVDGLGDAVFFKGGAEVAEVIPSGVGGDETARDTEAGMVVNGEEENLLLRRGPPLVNGTVVLPKLADVRPAETAVRANAWRWRREEMGKVCFEKGLDAGAGPDKAKETLQLIGDELKIGRAGQRDELLKKGEDIVRPDAPMSTAAGLGAERIPSAQPGGAQFVEPGLGDAQRQGSRSSIEMAGIELAENAADKLGRKAVEKLSLFIPKAAPRPPRKPQQKTPSVDRSPLRRPALRSGLLRGDRSTLPIAHLHPFRFCSVSIPVLYRPRQRFS
jgi:hypothetical protein